MQQAPTLADKLIEILTDQLYLEKQRRKEAQEKLERMQEDAVRHQAELVVAKEEGAQEAYRFIQSRMYDNSMYAAADVVSVYIK